jgi:hypothetical protein
MRADEEFNLNKAFFSVNRIAQLRFINFSEWLIVKRENNSVKQR